MDNKEKNTFESLCEQASKEKWCWKVPCTTCANYDFRYGFLQLADGKNPNNSDWMTTSYIEKNKVYEFPYEYSNEVKQSVLHICLESNLSNINKSCRFPDWLGYLGVVISHIEPRYYENKDLFYELSKHWTKQLREIVPKSSVMHDLLGKDGCGLSFSILRGCERALNGEEEREKQKEHEDLVKKQNDYDKNIYQILIDTINEESYTDTARLDIYVKQKHIEMLDSTQYEKLCKVLNNVNEANSYMGKFKEKFLSGSL